MIELSNAQEKALKTLANWLQENKSQYITLGGYAGTGKTTLIAYLRNQINELNGGLSVAFCAYTGKASRVLLDKLENTQAIYKQDYIGTIHSLIYSPIVNSKEEIVGWERKEKINNDLIIVDEASMLDENIWQDLLAYKIPIVAIGDHGQLPPIKGSFNLMQKPMLKLEEIHRQAKDNPIIQLSILAREKGEIPYGNFGTNIKKIKRADSDTQELIRDLLGTYNKETMILCGYNNTRVKLNKHLRQVLEFEPNAPQAGDRVICLRNNHAKSIYNGMLGKVVKINLEEKEWYMAEIKMDSGIEFKGLVYAEQFNNLSGVNFTQDRSKVMKGDLFDYGYALTVHKAQGSQAKRVILFEERFKQMSDDDWKKWLYTGITRAEEELFIIG